VKSYSSDYTSHVTLGDQLLEDPGLHYFYKTSCFISQSVVSCWGRSWHRAFNKQILGKNSWQVVASSA